MDFRGRRQQCGNAVSERNFRQRPHQRPPSSLHCSRHRAAREANRPIPAPQTPVSLSSAGPLASSMRVPWERRRRNWARDLVGARRQGCRLGAARSAALHEKHANLGYASLTSCLKSPRRGQRPSICEELVLGNSTLKKPTWANAELYGDNHSHRAFQTRWLKTALFRLTHRRFLSTILDFREKGVASVASRMTMHQPILEGGRGVGD